MPQENVDILKKLISDLNVKTVIEIGSFVGKSTVFFAQHVESVIAVDTFNAINQAQDQMYLNNDRQEFRDAAMNQYTNFLVNTLPYKNIRHIVMDSRGASQLPIDADLVYIDAGHTYQMVADDIRFWISKAKKVICGDDCTKVWPGVVKAASEIGADTNQRVWFRKV